MRRRTIRTSLRSRPLHHRPQAPRPSRKDTAGTINETPPAADCLRVRQVWAKEKPAPWGRRFGGGFPLNTTLMTCAVRISGSTLSLQGTYSATIGDAPLVEADHARASAARARMDGLEATYVGIRLASCRRRCSAQGFRPPIRLNVVRWHLERGCSCAVESTGLWRDLVR